MIEQFYDLRPEVLALDRKALDLCRAQFAHVEEIRDYNQLKMLRAFTDCGVEARHFWGSSGYGVWDDSRNKLEEVFARCMGAEAALVRPQFMSGTHTLTVALFGLLRTGDTLLAATGLQRQQQLPIVNLREVNPYVAAALGEWRSRLSMAAAPSRQSGAAANLLEAGAQLLAGTSSFGMSGVNAHALLSMPESVSDGISLV